MRKLNIVLITIFTFLIVTGFTYQGNAQGVYGCYQKEHGQLRIISDHGECLKSEAPIPLIEVLNEIDEYCFEVETEDGTLWGIVKLGLSHIVDGYYSVRGKTYYDNPQIIRGNAEIKGSNILLTATHTSKGEKILSIGKSHMLIDRTTFKGQCEITMRHFNYSDMSMSRDYENASLINIPCPD